MAASLDLRKRIRSLALKALIAIVAGIALGNLAYLEYGRRAARRVVAVPITHSTPVGGKIQDGVFRSTPDVKDTGLTHWRI